MADKIELAMFGSLVAQDIKPNIFSSVIRQKTLN